MNEYFSIPANRRNPGVASFPTAVIQSEAWNLSHPRAEAVDRNVHRLRTASALKMREIPRFALNDRFFGNPPAHP